MRGRRTDCEQGPSGTQEPHEGAPWGADQSSLISALHSTRKLSIATEPNWSLPTGARVVYRGGKGAHTCSGTHPS
jgi:hypothetical protein